MASVNKYIAIGRLTRDPERKSFDTGATVTRFGLAVNEKRKDRDGKTVEDVLFLDCQAWNRGNYTLADLIDEYCRKGDPIYIEGKLRLEEWKGQDGEKKSKMVVNIEGVQFLGGKKDDDRGRRDRDLEPRRESRRQRSERGSDYRDRDQGEREYAVDIPF